MPVLGLGTWRMGENAGHRAAEVKAVREAIALGYRLIDTAEMYGEGGAETVVGQAIAEALRAGDARREELFVVSKVYPHNASRRGTRDACERSLKRLGLDASTSTCCTGAATIRCARPSPRCSRWWRTDASATGA